MQIKIDEKWKDIYTYIQIINHFFRYIFTLCKKKMYGTGGSRWTTLGN